ncbi:MAG TPA: diacylglycerol kinase family lipid kinase [Myxococcales bacterium]|nr:diacylglycerol kinase family lipid kinase [Myxococcales bacterium]
MNESYRTLVIVNPCSGNGSTGRRWRSFEQRLGQVLSDFDVVHTTARGHATELSSQGLRDGYQMIVAVGGDGTVHEVVNGFFDEAGQVIGQPVLGLMPAGTGGDYRKLWGLSSDTLESIDRLAGKDVQLIDAGKVTWNNEAGQEQRRYFANIASVGLGGAVSKQANEQSKILGGKVSFFIASARALLRHNNKDLTLETDGKNTRQALITMAAFCIGRYFGGGMMVAPNADPSDGLLDVVTVENATRMEMIAMTSIYKGEHLDNPKVQWWQGAEVLVSNNNSDECLIELDGEIYGTLPARFSVLHQAFNIKI